MPEPMKLPRMEKRAAQSPNRRKTCPFIRKVTRAAILEARLMHLVFPEAVRTSIRARPVRISTRKVPVPGP